MMDRTRNADGTDPKARPPRKRSATRERLLDAAYQVMVAQGIQGVSVEHICAEAGYTRGAFYSNFASKDELVMAMFEHEKQKIFSLLDDATADTSLAALDDESAFAAIIDRFLRAVPNNREQYVVSTEFALHALRDTQIAAAYGHIWSTILDDLCGIIIRVVQQRGREFTVDANDLAAIVIGAWEISLRSMLLTEAKDAEHLLRRTMPTVLMALTRPQADGERRI